MAKRIKQIRYYNENNAKNYPGGTSLGMTKLINGSAFKINGNNVLITQLGIQTVPGVKFYLNESDNSVMVGSTGIYELDLEGISYITSIKFDKASMNLINQNTNAYLIVDILYEEG